MIEVAWFNQDDKPMPRGDGRASERHRYDERNNVLDKSLFDSDGKPLPVEVIVVRVLAKGEGERIGVKPDDVLVSYDGRKLNGPLQAYLGLQVIRAR